MEKTGNMASMELTGITEVLRRIITGLMELMPHRLSLDRMV
jgi:hypothetical protein